MRIPTSLKVDFCNTSLAKFLVFQSQTSRTKPKNHQKKQPGIMHEQTHLFRYPKSCQNEVSKSNKNESNQAWTSKRPLLCSPVSQDCPKVPQDARVKPPSMPNDRFGYHKCQDPLASMLRICNARATSDGWGPAAEGVAHKLMTSRCWVGTNSY